MAYDLQINLLGGFECRAAGGECVHFPTRKVRALCVWLALHADEPQARDRLATLLWGEQSDASARLNLRKALSRLRACCPGSGSDCLITQDDRVTLLSDRVTVDVAHFLRSAQEATPASLERAAALYRGPLLLGFPACGEVFDDCITAERQRLEDTYCSVLHRLLEHHAATGAIESGVQTALSLLRIDPLQEHVHQTLMRLYLYLGRPGAALAQYRRCRELLAEELGVEPSTETEQLKAILLEGQTLPATTEDDAPSPGVHPIRTPAEHAREQPSPVPPRSGRPMVAVLSFALAIQDPGLRLLGDGMAEDIAIELGRFRELDVIAPPSALAYRDATAPPERIGKELGATCVVSGALQEAASGLRITIRLLDTTTGRQLWAERYVRRRGEMFELQDEIVHRLVAELADRIEDDRLAAARRKTPSELEAYDLWLRGRATLRRTDLAALKEARGYFQQAIARDPHFGRPHVGLALAQINEWACFSWNHWVFPRQEVLEHVDRALELDEYDQHAHCVLAMARLYAGHYETARHGLLRALELNPNDADVLAHAALGLTLIGDHEPAVEHGRNALRLAPHAPDWYTTFAGMALFNARQYEQALATMAPAPEAICNTSAFIAAAEAHLGRAERCSAYRETVHAHYQRELERGALSAQTSCVDWLLTVDPFRLDDDVAHYVDGLRRAGFL